MKDYTKSELQGIAALHDCADVRLGYRVLFCNTFLGLVPSNWDIKMLQSIKADALRRLQLDDVPGRIIANAPYSYYNAFCPKSKADMITYIDTYCQAAYTGVV